MFSNHCKQNSILCNNAPYVITQGGQHSGVVQSGKVMKKKVCLKLVRESQGMSGDLKKSNGGLS